MFMRLLSLCLLVLAAFSCQANAFCTSNQYECDNGECVFDSTPECDGYEDCSDGSDEDSCVDVVGIAVGVSVAGFVLFIICPIAICLIVWCCLIAGASNAANRRPQRRVVTTYPTIPVATAPMATMVSAQSESTDYFPKQEPPPPYYGQPQAYPAQPYSPSGYPPSAPYPPQPGYYPHAYP